MNAVSEYLSRVEEMIAEDVCRTRKLIAWGENPKAAWDQHHARCAVLNKTRQDLLDAVADHAASVQRDEPRERLAEGRTFCYGSGVRRRRKGAERLLSDNGEKLVYQDYTQVVGGPPRVRAFKFVKNHPDYPDYWIMVADATGASFDEAFAKVKALARNLTAGSR